MQVLCVLIFLEVTILYVGNQSLRNCTTSDNTAVGFQALYNVTTGLTQAAFGKNALFSVTTGNYNNAFGEGRLFY